MNTKIGYVCCYKAIEIDGGTGKIVEVLVAGRKIGETPECAAELFGLPGEYLDTRAVIEIAELRRLREIEFRMQRLEK